MSQSLVSVESVVKDLLASLPKHTSSAKMPELARAINLAIDASKNSAESASILARLSKKHPEISKQALLAAEVASEAATFAASVASLCIECTYERKPTK
ncbi:MAG: hypothetical protein QXU32_05830 [Nitrososphaerales archaeon]